MTGDVPSSPPEVCVFLVASSILLILLTFLVLFYSLSLLLLSFLYLYFWHFPLIQIITRHYSISWCLLSSLEDNQRILRELISLYCCSYCYFNHKFTTTYQCYKFNPEHNTFKHFTCFIYQTCKNKTYCIRLW